MIYLDNAATSWPKPPEVNQAMHRVLETAGGNPGRSGHRLSVAAARVIYDCRENLAAFFNLADPLRLIFTPNATFSLNLVLNGFLHAGDRVVTTAMEHNAVMRPLRHLEQIGVEVVVAPCSPGGLIDEERFAQLIKSPTRLVVINHASNVTGTLAPLSRLTDLAHQKGALVLVDASQSAGLIPLDMAAAGIDFLAFTGHKELLGPTGTGGLAISPSVDISAVDPLVRGGTGSRSESEFQPDDLPDKYESGTANLIGLAGLDAALDWIRQKSPEAIRQHAIKMKPLLLEGLSVIPGVTLYGPLDPNLSVSIVSFTITGKSVSEIGWRLDEDFAILTRVGLHCAPAAHQTIGTFPEGTVRLSPGIFTTAEEISRVLSAVQEVALS